ncbi:hypothetical protein N9251_02845, partial [Gammaproteobacteria bacterium]|nr:hypothetical protein [Gammaproteobacteria bacterium]
VDLKAWNSVDTAQIESDLKVKASYYFRVVPESDVPEAISKIVDFKHEIGYHYEDMSLCNGKVDEAIKHFENKLEYFRSYYPVTTICMHGAPTSKYDGKDLWKKYNYRDYGIIGEPYFDVNFDDLFYLTDTGRRWDGYKVSVRDKVAQQEEWNRKGLSFHSTSDLIEALKSHKLPNRIMITTHPQRWTNNYGAWLVELVTQRIKNMVKRVLIAIK